PLGDTVPRDVLTPSPRLVSETLLAREVFRPATTLNVLAAAWLQFEIHDWLTHRNGSSKDPWVVPLETTDPWPHPPMQVRRTPRTSGDDRVPSFANTATHWWDGSQLYGSSADRQRPLRTHEGGKMLIGPNGVVPYDPATGREMAGVVGNWWVGLGLMHSIFLREHNAICDRLAGAYPGWSDQELFDHARLVNAALMAKIQTVEWSTAVVASTTMRTALRANWWGLAGEWWTEHFGRIDAHDEVSGVPGAEADLFGVPYSMTEEFVSVYRMHPLIPDDFSLRSARDDSLIEERSLPQMVFSEARPVLERVPVADLLYSLGTRHPGVIGLHNTSRYLRELRRPDGELIDLAAVDVLRDRERGVPRYNEFRRRFRLDPARTFADFSSDEQVVEQLARVYDSPEDVDALVGMFAEAPPPGFAFSDTAFRVFILMATRRLKADRFFTYDYRPEVYTEEGLEWVRDNTMRSVLLRHHPELEPALRSVDNPFKPWNTIG
ncbi:MAG TPA: peroxidase family protein, partial [Acidimicrobiales bacterium]